MKNERDSITAKKCDTDRIMDTLKVIKWCVIFVAFSFFVLWSFVMGVIANADESFLFPVKDPQYRGKKIVCSSWYTKMRTESGRTYQYKALNYPARYGTDIVASGAGVVKLTDISGYEGGTITVQYDNGVSIRVCHISKQCVLEGTRVKAGDVIAKVGNSGRTTGPHVRIVVEKNGERIFCNAETWGKKYDDFHYTQTEFDASKTSLYKEIEKNS